MQNVCQETVFFKYPTKLIPAFERTSWSVFFIVFAPFVIDPKLVMNSTIILLKCTHSSLSHIRGIFLESLYSINSNFMNMSCKALFLYIMSMCDQNILNLSASYIENILNCYASEL